MNRDDLENMATELEEKKAILEKTVGEIDEIISNHPDAGHARAYWLGSLREAIEKANPYNSDLSDFIEELRSPDLDGECEICERPLSLQFDTHCEGCGVANMAHEDFEDTRDEDFQYD